MPSSLSGEIQFFLASCLSSPDKDKEEEPMQNIESSLLKYDIIEKKDISFAGNSRMVNRVLLNVTELQSEEVMKVTAREIWENGNKNWDEFTVFMYLPEMDVEWVAYGIGEFRPTGLLEFRINESALYDTKWYVQKDKTQLDSVPKNEMKEYHVDIAVNEEEKRTVSVNVETNFPDGTNLHVSIGRNHYLKGKSELYSGDLFSEDLTVQNGSIYITVTINDTKWYNEYQDLVKALPNDFPPISTISDSITIRVMFSEANILVIALIVT